jgi:hypothetical protein
MAGRNDREEHEMRCRTQRRQFGFTVVVVALLGLSACGGSAEADDDGTAEGEPDPATASETESPDADAEALVFAQCMRDNGVDMPDPAPGQDGFFDAFHGIVNSYDRGTIEQAVDACRDSFPTYAGEDHGQDDDAVLALAECLREQGLDVPDNLFQGGELPNVDQDELSAALEECRDVWSGENQ